MKKAFIFCFVILAAAFYAASLKAQVMEAVIVYPQNAAYDVELKPTIRIDCTQKFDSSSITFTYPNRDSSIANSPNSPTCTLLPKMVADSVADSLYRYIAIPGDFQLINGDQTLLWTPVMDLPPNTELTLLLRDLRCLVQFAPGGGYDTIALIDQQINFKTVNFSHFVSTNSIMNNPFVNCGDTISFNFNAPLARISTSMGSIASIEKFNGVTRINDTLYTQNYSSVPVNAWIDNSDHKIMRVKPTASFTPGGNYVFKLKLNRLTGDSADILEYPFIVNSHYTIKMKAEIDDSLHTTLDSVDSYPLCGSKVFTYGDSIKISTPLYFDNYVFKKWICPESEQINESTEPILDYTASCSNLKDLSITALYVPQDTITLTIIDSAHINFRVYSSDMTYLGGSGQYSIAPQDFVIVEGEGSRDSSYSFAFKGFGSNKPGTGIDFDPNPRKKISNRGDNINLWGVEDEIEIETRCHGTAHIMVSREDGSSCSDGDMINFTPTPLPVTNPTDKTNYYFDLGEDGTITDLVFEIKNEFKCCFSIEGMVGYDIISETYNSDRTLCTLRVQSDCTTRLYDMVLKKRTTTMIPHTLTVQTELDQTTDLTAPNPFSGIGKNKDVTVKIEIYNSCHELKMGPFYTDENQYIIENLTDEDIVTLTPISDPTDGFDFVEWHDGTGYYYPTPKTSKPFTFIMNGDKLVKAKFIEHFRITDVGFYQGDDRTTIKWYTVKELKAKGMVYDVDVYNYYTGTEDGYNARIFLKFNSALDMTTVTNNITCTDMTERVDDPTTSYPRHHTGNKYIYRLNNNPSPTIGNCGIIDAKTISFDLVNKTTSLIQWIPKGEQFVLNITNSVKNTKSRSLMNPGAKANAETELPGILWTWDAIEFSEYSGDGAIENATIWAAQVLRENTPKYNVMWALPTVAPYSYFEKNMIPGEGKNTYETIINCGNPKPYNNYSAQMSVVSYDTDYYGDDDIRHFHYESCAQVMLNYGYGYWSSYFTEVGKNVKYKTLDWVDDQLEYEIPGQQILDAASILAYGSWQGLAAAFGTVGIGALVTFFGTIAVLVAFVWLLVDFYRPDPLGGFTASYTWQNKWFGAHPNGKWLSGSNWLTVINSHISRYQFRMKLKKTQDNTSTNCY